MARRSWHFVFAGGFDPEATTVAARSGRVTVVPPGDQAALTAALHDADALLVRTTTAVTGDLLAAAPRLRVVGRGGVGLDNINLDAAAEHRVIVMHTPGAATDAVADLALALMLALLRRIPWHDRAVRSGCFAEARAEHPSHELSQLTVGVIGLGRIGQAVAARCRGGFGCRIIFNDIVDPGWTGLVAEPRCKDDLFAESDVVSLHVPLTDATRRLINRDSLSRFKRGALLINTSRGGVVDGVAVADALESGLLGGAGLDVCEPEPLPLDHPLIRAPNTILTPHIGACTQFGQRNMNAVVKDVIRVLEVQSPEIAVIAGTLGRA